MILFIVIILYLIPGAVLFVKCDGHVFEKPGTLITNITVAVFWIFPVIFMSLYALLLYLKTVHEDGESKREGSNDEQNNTNTHR